MNILHAALEYKALVGGVGYVTEGLTDSLSRQGNNVSIVTPGFDIYFNEYYSKDQLQFVDTIKHIYKGQTIESNIYKVENVVQDGKPVTHYLVSPAEQSIANNLLHIGSANNIYQALPWSNSLDRMEYFNSAITSMLRLPNDKLPTFDVYHTHAWHTGIASVLSKELENLPAWRPLYNYARDLKKVPHVVSTIHMLRATDHAELRKPEVINNMITSIGMPADFLHKFKKWGHYINDNLLKRVVLSLLYADHITGVSPGLVKELISYNPQGLADLFTYFKVQNRISGILNGIVHKKYDGTNPDNHGEYALDANSISSGKQRIKDLLAAKYPKLDPNKTWFSYIARFAQEKGVNWLKTTAKAVSEQDGIFIIMGKHVVQKMQNGKLVSVYKELIDELRDLPNVVVIDDQELQDLIGNEIRAATDCFIILSDNEACGLPQIEGFPKGAIAVGPNIQGVPNSIKDLRNNPKDGSGFLYDDKDRLNSIPNAIKNVSDFLHNLREKCELDTFLKNLFEYSKQFDWDKSSGIKFHELYQSVVKRPLLTPEQIHPQKPPMMINAHNQPKNPPYHIFCIGFNKSGTTSLDAFFRACKNLSLHYAINYKTLASIMLENYRANKPILTGIERFKVFSDMEDIYHPEGPLYFGQQYFKILEQQYPTSKFVLNTRSKEAWIRSRLNHIDPVNGQNYADVLSIRYGCTKDELIQKWSKEWDMLHAEVKDYFKDKPEKLLIFDLEDPNAIHKLCDFFDDLSLDPEKFVHANKTPESQKQLVR